MAGFSCSFCGKGEDEVARLVSGPRVFICNECVILCTEIIAEGPRPELNEGAMDNVRQVVARIAITNLNVLFHGPPGAGKSFLARTIHRLSGSTGELFTLDCDGPEVELEVGLFGCERNALRATPDATMGALEAANGGTVFLRSVLSLPEVVQAKLLRAIEDRVVFRVGGIQPRRIDARFISATRQDPAAAVQAGAFRSDLFYRLNGITLELPPLRRRREDIPALVDESLEDFRRELGRPAPLRITPEAMETLCHYPWPGNVAQLRAVVRRALLLCEGAEISVGHLTIEMPTPLSEPMPAPRAEKPNPVDEDARRRILEALAAVRGSAVRKHPPRELRQPPEPPPKPPEPRCSICGLLKTQAGRLFHGTSAFICDGCVAEGQAAIAAHAPEAGASGSTEAGSAPKRADVGCAFCGKCEAELAHLVGVEDHQLICDRCLDAYDQSLADQFSAESWRGRTFALRSTYSGKKIDDILSQAREDLARGRACYLVVLAESGDPDAARGLLDRVKGSLAELADVWEPAPDRRIELTAVAFPRPGRRA